MGGEKAGNSNMQEFLHHAVGRITTGWNQQPGGNRGMKARYAKWCQGSNPFIIWSLDMWELIILPFKIILKSFGIIFLAAIAKFRQKWRKFSLFGENLTQVRDRVLNEKNYLRTTLLYQTYLRNSNLRSNLEYGHILHHKTFNLFKKSVLFQQISTLATYFSMMLKFAPEVLTIWNCLKVMGFQMRYVLTLSADVRI